jgi:hypothetical protein
MYFAAAEDEVRSVERLIALSDLLIVKKSGGHSMLFPILFDLLSCSVYKNDTTLVIINSDCDYLLGPGADGALFHVLDGVQSLTFSGEVPRVSFIIQFDDDDFHNGELILTFSDVRVTFACDDIIRFRISCLNATNTQFFSTKHMEVAYTSANASNLDYYSFASGFGPEGVFYRYLVADSRVRPNLEVAMGTDASSATLDDEGFTILTSQTVTSFLDSKGFNFVLKFLNDQPLAVNTLRSLT